MIGLVFEAEDRRNPLDWLWSEGAESTIEAFEKPIELWFLGTLPPAMLESCPLIFRI